jgi:tetratricopeptide (TPR) repeat protein
MPIARLLRPLAMLAALSGGIMAATAPASAQDRSGLAGPYLAARLAVRDGDHREAASYFAQALRADPQNPLLISNAVFANAALGEWDIAANIAEDLPPDANGQELAGLVIFVDTVRSRDLSRSREAIEAGRGGGPFVDELSMGWIEFGAGNMDRAVAVFEELTEDQGLSELAWLHLGLARAAVGDFEAADEILSGDRAGRISQTERVVRVRAEILVQLGRRAEALDLLDGYTQRVPDPALLALQARIGAGAEGPYDFVTTWYEGISEVFFTVSQAFGSDSNGNLPLIYARAAYGVSEKNTDALILAGELLSSVEQYELAAETYGAVPADDDQFIEAQMGRAEALERQGAVDDALAVLRELAEAQPELAPIHAALGDTLRRAEMCEDAIDSYSAALDRVNTDRAAILVPLLHPGDLLPPDGQLAPGRSGLPQGARTKPRAATGTQLPRLFTGRAAAQPR